MAQTKGLIKTLQRWKNLFLPGAIWKWNSKSPHKI